jgi:predicted transcriptional regulator
MNEKLLCQLGLSKNQAHTYRLLVERGSLRPVQLAKISHESRANCYALLDKLVELGLAQKTDENKKLTYYPESPAMLEKLIREEVARVQSNLLSLQKALPQMLTAFNNQGGRPRVEHYKGKAELEGMYTEQMKQPSRELYFIRSLRDLDYFGFTKMDELRRLAPKYGVRRHGLTPIMIESPGNPHVDGHTNLHRTWLPKASYTAPVEWAVSGDLVQIIDFTGEGYGISIKNKEIAESFRQILKLFSEFAKKDPAYKTSPKFKQPQK